MFYIFITVTMLLTGVIIGNVKVTAAAERNDHQRTIAVEYEMENEEHEIEFRQSETEKMESLENQAMKMYQTREDHSLQNAFIIKNLYGNAPLTAIAMFETEEICDVTVCVKGKTPEMDVVYRVSDYSREHQIGIYGMYAGYENHVVITAGKESHEFLIITPELPENITSIHKTGIDTQEEVLGGQMILLQDGWYTLFDQMGDIRWYIGKKWHTNAVSGAFTIDDQKNGIWFTYGTTNGSPYRDGSQLIHMDWFGRIDGIYSYDGYCSHHYIELLPNGHLLYPGTHDGGRNKFLELDPETGDVEIVLDLENVDWLDPSVGNINPRSEQTEDWAHPNSIVYVEERDCLLISLRNQHMLINLDYSTKEPNWILTSAFERDEADNIQPWQEKTIPYLIIPDEDFEWFYTQHDMQYVCGDETSIEFTIFDNGSLRYVGSDRDAEKDDGKRFSRMVRLRVDEQKRTVETVFEYGKNEGKYLFSRTFGNTQFIAENGHYLGCFVCKNDVYQEVSKIVEVDQNAKPVSYYTVGNIKEGCYRASAVFYNDFDMNTNFEAETIEIHQFQAEQWEKILFPETYQSYENLQVSEIYRDIETISIYGKALVNKEYETESIWLTVDDGEGNIYGFPMISTQIRGGGFYGIGIPLKGIPEGTYRISVLAIGKDGSSYHAGLGSLLTVSDSTY